MSNVGNITSSNPGRNGVFFRGPVGIKLPESATEDLAPQFEDQGTVGEDGVVQAIARDTEDQKAYGGDTVYTVQTDYSQTITLTVYESVNMKTLRTAFGDQNVVETAEGFKVMHNRARLQRSAMVWDHLIDQGLTRQVAEQAQVVSVGDINRVHTGIVSYELEIRLYPGADGNLMVEYTALLDGQSVLQINSQVVIDGREGEEYAAVLQASGGTGKRTFSAVGSLPAGLNLNADTGLLSGTPTTAGVHEFTIKVADEAGAEVTKTFSITVATAADSGDGGAEGNG